MTIAYVQFSDATQKTVISIFGCPQDDAIYPNQAAIDDSDVRYQAFVNPASTLAGAQSAQINNLAQNYAAAIAAPVNFTTAAGTTAAFQVDPVSVQNVGNMLAAFSAVGSVPAGFYWVAADNTQVLFTLSDLQGLAKAMGTQGWSSFQHLQTQKAAILAAKTVSKVTSITW